jgi:uncharacterized protein YqeY
MDNLINDKIDMFIMSAMKAHDTVRTETLRGMKTAFMEWRTAKDNVGKIFNETTETQILNKMVKQRKDSAQIYIDQNRPELAENELAEVAVIEAYLPKQMSDEELTAAVKEIIAEVGATSAKDMGKVMGIASKKLAGKAEGRAISEKVKTLLNQM